VSTYNDQFWDSGGYWPYDNFTDMGLDLYGSGLTVSDMKPHGNRVLVSRLRANLLQLDATL